MVKAETEGQQWWGPRSLGGTVLWFAGQCRPSVYGLFLLSPSSPHLQFDQVMVQFLDCPVCLSLKLWAIACGPTPVHNNDLSRLYFQGDICLLYGS